MPPPLGKLFCTYHYLSNKNSNIQNQGEIKWLQKQFPQAPYL